jgi:lipid A 3-O-deacylase
MIRKIAAAAALVSAAAALPPAYAVDGAALELGTGDESSELVRGSVLWKWDRKWFADTGWEVSGYWEASVGAWTTDKTLMDFGFTPVFRLQRRDWIGPYVEAAIGLHFLSDLSISRTRLFGSRFQFGDHLAAGWRFGPRGRYDLGIRMQHLSNGGLKEPNPGINFAVVRFAWLFD